MDKFVSVERSDLWIFVRLAQRSFRGAKATKTWPNYRKASVEPSISSTFHNTSTIISMHWILVWLYPKSVCLPGLPWPWPCPWQAAKITLTLHNSNFIIWCPLSPSQRVLLPRQLALGAAMCASQVSDQVRCMLERPCDPICWCCVWCWCLCWCWCWCKPGVPPGEFYAFSKNPFYILTRWIFCIRVLLIKTIFIFYSRREKTWTQIEGREILSTVEVWKRKVNSE